MTAHLEGHNCRSRARAGPWACGALLAAALASLVGVRTLATQHRELSSAAAYLATATAGSAVRPAQGQETGTPPGTPSAPLPDLVIDALAVTMDPSAYCRQGPLGTWLVVSNAGEAPAGPFRVRVSSVVHDGPGLAVGATLRLWFSGYVNGAQGETTAEVDLGDRVREINEDNNVLRVRLAVPTAPPTCPPTASPTPPTGTPPPMPDLVPEFGYWWHCGCWPCPDREPYGVVCIVNRGSAPADPADNVLEFYQVHELLDSPALEQRASACRRIPSVSLGAIADVGQAVPESNEVNNRGRGSAPTYSPPPPCRLTIRFYLPVAETGQR